MPHSFRVLVANGAATPWTSETKKRVKDGLQRQVAKAILHTQRPDAEERVRNKLGRWRLLGPPGIVACRATRRMGRLASLVTQRIASVCSSTLWKQRITARRFQRRAHACNRCVLGFCGAAEDSI